MEPYATALEVVQYLQYLVMYLVNSRTFVDICQDCKQNNLRQLLFDFVVDRIL